MNDFDPDEILIRAEREWELFSDGRIKPVFLMDQRGLSVDLVGERSLSDAIESMQSRLAGAIYSVTVADCDAAGAVVVRRGTSRNPFHAEIHGSNDSIELNDDQARLLASRARRVAEPKCRS